MPTPALTRRSLLLAAVAASAAPLLRWRADAADPAGPAPVERLLTRGVALGPGGIGNQQRYPSNRRFAAETGCTWVRLWAEWPKLQPSPDRPPDFRGLDAEIAAAHADGLKVMLTSWRAPRWANGTAALREGDPAAPRDLTFRVTSDTDAFGRWIEQLGRRGADAVEVVNEPNFQLFPQRGVAAVVAQMIVAARAAFDRIGERAPLLVAPATADRTGSSALDTDYLEFTRELLDELDRASFRADARIAWSHHNYGDVESDSADRIGALHELLVGRWSGWPDGDARAPGILVTESGARLSTIEREEGVTDPDELRRRQAELIAAGYERLRVGPEGAGVAMVLQYLFITDANYDTGLCEPDGRPRPAYYAWAELP